MRAKRKSQCMLKECQQQMLTSVCVQGHACCTHEAFLSASMNEHIP